MNDRKFIVHFLLFFVFLIHCVTQCIAEGTSAKGAYIMDLRSGRMLFASNENDAMPMASTTKVMTALLALENGDLDAPVTVGVNAYGRPGTSIYLGLDETLRLEEMLYGLMIASGNDAAVAIAEHIGGTADRFCQMMTERAAALGAASTDSPIPTGFPQRIIIRRPKTSR